MTRRAMSALVTGEPDTVEPPMRRLTVTTISGIMIAIVVAAVFAVIGILRPGSGNDWEEDGTVVVERETGARFLVIEGRLHPVLNFPSAVLASGATSTVEPQLVARSELASVERGPAIGIPSLPDSVPSADDLVAGPITVCSQAVADGADVSTQVSVDIGSDPGANPLSAEDGIYVQSFEGERYLIWRGQRHLIDERVIQALAISARPVLVGRAFLTAVPQGTAFQTPEISGAGGTPDIPEPLGLVVGQVVEVDDGSLRVVLEDGLATVTDIQARLLATVDLGGDGSRRQLSLAQVLDLPESSTAATDLAEQTEGLPASVPVLTEDAGTAGGVCASYVDGQTTPDLSTPETTAPANEPTADGERSQQGFADEVSVAPGAGVLAQAPRGTAVSLITEPGLRFPAADLETLAGFGYGEEDPVELPAELLAMIPTGDALDPESALAQISS